VRHQGVAEQEVARFDGVRLAEDLGLLREVGRTSNPPAASRSRSAALIARPWIDATAT
jgi:hypothetical protein